MIERALHLHEVSYSILTSNQIADHAALKQAIDTFLGSSDFEDLRRYILSPSEWDALENFRKILAVSLWIYVVSDILTV